MAHTIYENIILSNKINDILTTQIDLNSYMTIDTSMTEQAGMKKIINTYTATGEVEELGMGEGNSTEITVSFTPAEYEVKTYQGKFGFYDEQEMTDPMIVDTGLDGAAKTMINNFTEKAIEEFEKATLTVTPAVWSFDAVVDAVLLPRVHGVDECLFCGIGEYVRNIAIFLLDGVAEHYKRVRDPVRSHSLGFDALGAEHV